MYVEAAGRALRAVAFEDVEGEADLVGTVPTGAECRGRPRVRQAKGVGLFVLRRRRRELRPRSTP